MATDETFSLEVQAAFDSWIKARGIQVALFDLDDTLIDTHSHFGSYQQRFLETCRESLAGIEMDDLWREFRRVDDDSYQHHGVKPQKWEYVASELSRIYGNNSFMTALPALMEMYATVPRLNEGVRSTLQAFKKSGVRLGLVTHATEEWTDMKVDQLGLREHFEHIKVISILKHKYKESLHWQEAIDQFGVDPVNMMAIGDNLSGDIRAAFDVGVRTLVWIPGRWQVYSRGTVPEGTYVVDRIGNVIPNLIGR